MTAHKKHSLRGWISRMNLRNKIVLCIYGVMLPVLVVSGVTIIGRNYVNEQQRAITQYERAAQSVADELSYLQQDMVDIITYFCVNNHVRNVLQSDPQKLQGDSLFWQSQTPIEFLKDILGIKTALRTVILYPENGLSPFYVSNDSTVHNTNLTQIKELPMYRQSIDARGDIVWTYIPAQTTGFFLRNRTDKIVASRILFDLSKRRALGFLAISMNADTYRAICSNQLLSAQDGIVVLSASGDVIVDAGSYDADVLALLQDGTAAELLKNKERFHTLKDTNVMVGRNKNSDTLVCYLSPKSEWDARMREGLQIPVFMAIALFIATWPLSSLVSRALARSTNELNVAMKNFREGDFTQQVNVRSQDEIGQISQAFNQMVVDIRELVDKNYIMALRERESELDALQAQINPHFLYNVMDSLYWQAVDAGSDELADDILALSNLFRLLLSQGQSDIPVGSEIELIGYYLQIQKMRFSKRLCYTIDVEDALLEEPIPKLTLQPFVENAIVHGLEKTAEGGVVEITGRKVDSQMAFTISDNGVGMLQADADRMLRADESKDYAHARIGHYAISNIKERLALRYGDRATLTIRSDPNVGTTVKVSLPIREAGGAAHVKA